MIIFSLRKPGSEEEVDDEREAEDEEDEKEEEDVDEGDEEEEWVEEGQRMWGGADLVQEGVEEEEGEGVEYAWGAWV